MARYIIVALLLVAVICVMQAYAAPAEATTPASTSVEDALKKAGESITNAFNQAKPQLEEILSKSKDFFEDVGKKISEEASKIIPKSDEAKP